MSKEFRQRGPIILSFSSRLLYVDSDSPYNRVTGVLIKAWSRGPSSASESSLQRVISWGRAIPTMSITMVLCLRHRLAIVTTDCRAERAHGAHPEANIVQFNNVLLIIEVHVVWMNTTQCSQNNIRADSANNAAAPSISVLAAVAWRGVRRTLLRD